MQHDNINNMLMLCLLFFLCKRTYFQNLWYGGSLFGKWECQGIFFGGFIELYFLWSFPALPVFQSLCLVCLVSCSCSFPLEVVPRESFSEESSPGTYHFDLYSLTGCPSHWPQKKHISTRPGNTMWATYNNWVRSSHISFIILFYLFINYISLESS